MRTANYAVMFTDIKGFTERTSRQTRAENARLLRLHDALLLPVIHGYGGRRVKTIGDAYLVVFDSATRALACGAALQDRLSLYNRWVRELDRIEVRVAVNAGEVRVAEGDVFGEAVNIAARVEEVADAGEVCFSEAVYLLADRSWIEVEELGPHTLRGVPEPVRLFRLRRSPTAELPYGGAALASLKLPDPTPETVARWRPGWRRLRTWLAGTGAAAMVALAVFGTLTLWRSPLAEVERLAESGRAREASERLSAVDPATFTAPERTYLEGVIDVARGDADGGIRRMETAARRDAKLATERVAPRLLGLLSHKECDTRSEAARVLGELRYEPALDELEALSQREPPSGGGFLARLRIGSCNAGDAARGAIAKIRGAAD